MSAAALYFRICDGCGMQSTPTYMAGTSLPTAKKNGWTRVSSPLGRTYGHDYCPTCTARKLQKKDPS